MGKVNTLKHVGFIMDGNGRWATNQGLNRIDGHKEGLKSLENLIRILAEDIDLKQASFYCFSTENWNRPALEVKAIMHLLKEFILKDIEKLWSENIEIRIKGDLSENSPFDEDLRNMLISINEKKIDNPKLIINLCINYGGQDEIVRATNSLINKNEAITVRSLNKEILDCDLDLDLIVRTSGENRLSNFLLWQSAYAEILFVDYHWPEINYDKYSDIKEDFYDRERRFGKVS